MKKRTIAITITAIILIVLVLGVAIKEGNRSTNSTDIEQLDRYIRKLEKEHENDEVLQSYKKKLQNAEQTTMETEETSTALEQVNLLVESYCDCTTVAYEDQPETVKKN